MTLGIMQPYFLPYLGYWQLLNHVDEFVIYDNIQFTKRGWIHRNRFLQNGKDEYFSLPLQKGSDYLNVVERSLADHSDKELLKTLRRIENNYRKAPHFVTAFPIFENIFSNPEKNLFKFIHQSVVLISKELGIDSKMTISSDLAIDHQLKGQNKVLEICNSLGADEYVNAIGGLELYDRQTFKTHGVNLSFIKPNLHTYPQFDNPFLSGLSILDAFMFLPKEEIKRRISSDYELI